MFEKIIKCYLVAKYNYDVFDEIVIFLTEDGKKLACYSSGSRKISSKNGMNLIIGNFLELEYFESRTNKLNKLKKVNSIRNIDYSISNNELFKLLNIMYAKIDWSEPNIEFYNLYQEALALILLSKNDSAVINYMIIKFLSLVNKNIELKICQRCNCISKLQSFSIQELGFVCFECLDEGDDFFTDSEIDYILEVIFNDFFLPSRQQNIDCLNISNKLTKKLIKYKNNYNK